MTNKIMLLTKKRNSYITYNSEDIIKQELLLRIAWVEVQDIIITDDI